MITIFEAGLLGGLSLTWAYFFWVVLPCFVEMNVLVEMEGGAGQTKAPQVTGNRIIWGVCWWGQVRLANLS